MAAKKSRAKEQEDEPVDHTVAVLMPGEPIKFKYRGDEVEVEVFPLGVRHLQKFPEFIARMMGMFEDNREVLGPLLADLNPEPKDDHETIGDAKKRAVRAAIAADEAKRKLIGIAAPLILKDGIDVIASCCKCTGLDSLLDAPHWVLPQVAHSFIDQTFGHGRVRPWLAAGDAALQTLTGKPSILSGALSKFSSLRGTEPKTSSASAVTGGPMSGGASRSSSSLRTKPPGN